MAEKTKPAAKKPAAKPKPKPKPAAATETARVIQEQRIEFDHESPTASLDVPLPKPPKPGSAVVLSVVQEAGRHADPRWRFMEEALTAQTWLSDTVAYAVVVSRGGSMAQRHRVWPYATRGTVSLLEVELAETITAVLEERSK